MAAQRNAQLRKKLKEDYGLQPIGMNFFNASASAKPITVSSADTGSNFIDIPLKVNKSKS